MGSKSRLRPAMWAGLLVLVAVRPALGRPQGVEDPQTAATRVASLVELAVVEYADAVARGKIVDAAEYEEARAFVEQAAEAFRVLEAEAGRRDAGELAARLDSLGTAIRERRDPKAFRQLAGCLVAGLARDWDAGTAVAPPAGRPSFARGRALYRGQCASCHGETGRGGGAAASGMDPPPADLASAARRVGATPARDFQVVTYGIPSTAMAGWSDRLSDAERWEVVAYVQRLRYGDDEVARGRALAMSRGSPIAGGIPSWADAAASARRSDADLAAEVVSAWSASGETLPPRDASAVVAFLRSAAAGAEAVPLPGTPGSEPARPSTELADRLARVDSLLGLVVALDRGERPDAAAAAAIDAYLAFEGLEAELQARSPETARAAERAFGELRAALGTPRLEASRAALGRELDRARRALDARSSAWTLAGQSFFIILREGFEAILIIGALIAFLAKTGNAASRRTVHAGVLAALAASLATAVALEGAFRAVPARQELLEGITMLVAALVLFSVSYWLLSKLDQQRWDRYLHGRVQRALGAGSALALASVAFLAVYREGFETVLFYKALFGFSGGDPGPVALGFAAGCAALGVIYFLFTRYGVRVPMRPFFALTSAVLYYMAVVFAGSGVRELQEGGVLSMTPVSGIPAVPFAGLYPTIETLAAQGVLLLLLVIALALTFAPSGRRAPVRGGRAARRSRRRARAAR